MKLTDMQASILRAAARHPERLVMPPGWPPAPRMATAKKLAQAGLMEEITVTEARAEYAWNSKGAGFEITEEGIALVGGTPPGEQPDTTAADDAVQHIEAAFDPLTGTAGAAPEIAITDPALAEQPVAQENKASWERATPAGKRAAEQKAKQEARAADHARRAAKGEAEAPADGAARKRRALADAEAAADRGELPEAPDFTAATHAPYRKRLAKLVAMAEAGDEAGLRAEAIKPTSTSPRALIRFRDLAVRAIAARAGAAA